MESPRAFDAEGYLTESLRRLESDVERAESREEFAELDERIKIAFQTLEINELLTTPHLVNVLTTLQNRVKKLQDTVSVTLPEQRVRDTFYNLMVTIYQTGLSNEALVALTMVEAIEQSSRLDAAAIACLGDIPLTLENCPEAFRELIQALIHIKSKHALLSKDESIQFKNALMSSSSSSTSALEPLITTIREMAQAICSRETFQNLIGHVLAFCSDQVSGSSISVIEPSVEHLRGVTEEVIRDTFYHHMAASAVAFSFIPRQVLEDRDSYVYLALSQHALVDVMRASGKLKNAIALLGDKAVTVSNCPEKYKELIVILLDSKEQLCRLTEEQIRMLKFSCIDDSEVDKELLALKTVELMKIAAQVNAVSSKISQLDTFKGIIESVIAFSLGD